MKGAAAWRSAVLAGLLIAVLLAFFLWNGPRPLVLDLAGSSAQMGRAFANAAPRRLSLLEKRYMRGIVCGGRPEAYQRAGERAGARLPFLQPAHRAEIRAFADAAGLSVDSAVLANAFIDMGLYRGACRSLVVDAEQGFYHAHNLDWDGLAGLANWVICLVRRCPDDGRFRTVSVSVVGLLGALDIINEHGIALSVNQRPGGTLAAFEPTFLRLRRIAEQARSFQQARSLLLEGESRIPFHITLSSAGEGRAAVFESGETFTERAMTGGVVAADNAFWGEESGRCPVERVARTRAVEEVADVQELLRDSRILLDCNIYSVIFDFAGNRLHLASGRSPAAEYRYRRFPLF